MKWRFLYILYFIFAVAGAASPVMANDCIEIISPPQQVFVSGKLMNLIFKVNGETCKNIEVMSSNPGAKIKMGPVVSNGIHHSSLLLTEGENRLTIKASQGEKVIAEKILTVFLKSNLVKEFLNPPGGFREYIFHADAYEKNCGSCHYLELLKGAKSQRDEKLPSCYTCHKRIVDYEFVHGPASVWACPTCHSNGSEKNKNAVRDKSGTLCQMCHIEDLASWEKEKFGHGPTLAGQCIVCHNPHASSKKFFLNKDTTSLCSHCHQEKLMYTHVITGFTNQGHPMSQKSDSTGKRAISCSSCHNPHAEDNVDLLIGYTSSKMDFCRRCHH